jgi:hypothetical protein
MEEKEGHFKNTNIEHRKIRFKENSDYAKEKGAVLLMNEKEYINSRNSVFTFMCIKHDHIFFYENYQLNKGYWCQLCSKENQANLLRGRKRFNKKRED